MKSPEERRTILVLVATAVVFGLIVSCGAFGGGFSGEPAAAPGAEQTAAVPEEVAAPTGATIAAKDAERLPPGQHAFVLPDMTRVVVTSGEPLPQSVRAHVQGQVNSVIQDPGVPGNITTNRSLIVDTAQGFAKKVGLQTGKQVVFVYPLIGGCEPSGEPYLGWAHTSVTYYDDFPCDVVPTREEAEQRVAAAVAAQPDPERYAVFVHGQ
ncbi:hypothetical protein [Oerskovia turbata]